MRTTENPDSWLVEPGLRLAIAYAGLTVALLAAAVLGLSPFQTLVVVGFVVLAASAAVPTVVSVGVGALGWAFYTGFVEHRYGELTFSTGDVLRLAALTAAAVWAARSTVPAITSSGPSAAPQARSEPSSSAPGA